MMKWLFSGLIMLSVIFGILTGKMEIVSRAAIEQCGAAVQLSLSLLGTICFWSGIMEIAVTSQFTKILSRLFYPLTHLLFRGLDAGTEALEAICMNITANFLGLGNAATPLGITAMEKLQQLSADKAIASDHMITFVVLNTCSIQLIPTTIITLRLAAGSENPMEIFPAVLLTSIFSLFSALTAAKICNRLFPLQMSGGSREHR